MPRIVPLTLAVVISALVGAGTLHAQNPPAGPATIVTPTVPPPAPPPVLSPANPAPTTAPAASPASPPAPSATPAPTPAAPPAPTRDEGAFTITGGRADGPLAPGDELVFAVKAPQANALYIWSFGDNTPPVTGTRIRHTYQGVDDFKVQLSTRRGVAQERLADATVRVEPVFVRITATDADNQFTPADQLQLAVTITAPGLAAIDISATGDLLGTASSRFELPAGERDYTLVLPAMRLPDETNSLILEEIIKKPGNTLPLRGLPLTLSYTPASAPEERVRRSLTADVMDPTDPTKVAAVSYPEIYKFSGRPLNDLEEDGYYLRGNADFNNKDDWYVRRMALEWGRRGGVWPDDPAVVAMNIFRTIDALFGDGDPGDFNNDYNVARLFEEGRLSKTSKNGAFICIAQAYLFSSVARTLGIPARETNTAIGEPSFQRADGTWVVKWWQEAGVELWYGEAWRYFDTWLAVTDRSEYLAKNLIYQTWHAFNRQTTEFITVAGVGTGLRGQNFNAWPGNPPQWSYIGEVTRPGVRVEGMAGEPLAPPITALPYHPAAPAVAAIAALPTQPLMVLDLLAAAYAP